MDCFICKTPFTLHDMSKHFKLVHELNEIDTYRCTFNKDCFQYCNSLRSLTRHFKTHLQREQSIRERDDGILISSRSSTSDNSQAGPSQTALSTFVAANSIVSNVASEIHLANPSSLSPVEVPSTLHFSQENVPNFTETGIAFALQLHSNNNFTRKDVISIQINVMQNIVTPMLATVQQFIKNNVSLEIEQTLEWSSLIQEIENPFRSCDTDYKLREWLITNDYICKFEEFTINIEIDEVYRCGELSYGEVETTGVLLPISFQFRKIFELNDQLLNTIKDMDKITNSVESNSNFIHGLLWREKQKSFVESGKIVIPYFLYIDDAEINNPLGSHCDPVSFLYYSFPVIENCEIYAAALFKGKDYKEFGNEKCLMSLVREMKKLEQEGVSIATSEGIKTVHFVLGLILGDNLGLNAALGFVASFSANYFCRFCKTIKTATHTACIVNPINLRNTVNYAEDVLAGEFSSTGIKENCIFNSIDSFHVTSNFAVDVMHDIYEGVCHYNMCHIIKKFIEMGYFDLNKLNDRKLAFNYGAIEIGNISPAITQKHLESCHLKMTAREMMSFVHLFSLIVGDLVPHDDEVWIFFLNFLEIIEVLLCYEIPRDLAEHMKYLIKRHHSDYVHLFNDTLKPKHHLMLHYHAVIMQSGPLRNFWCFRYETKHKDFKAYARAITSRKNVCVSLAKKFQLKFAHSLMQPVATKLFEVQQCHHIFTTHIELIRRFCEQNEINSNYQSYTECIYRLKQIKRGYFVSQYVDIDVENTTIFQIIEIILFSDHVTPHAICQRAKINTYRKHFAAYELDVSHTPSELNEYTILPVSIFTGPPINSHINARGMHLIRPKQYC